MMWYDYLKESVSAGIHDDCFKRFDDDNDERVTNM